MKFRTSRAPGAFLSVLATGALIFGGCGGGGGDGGTAPPTNDAPSLTVNVESGMRVVVSGDPVIATASAIDPEADPLTYVWRTVPAGWGSFTDSTAANTTWTAGTELGLVRLECEVSDGINAPVVRQSIEIETGTALPATQITTNTTWTVANSPYVLLGDLTVDFGATLTIEPGVQIYMRPSVSGPGSWSRHLFTVRGSLQAVGTSSSVGSSIRIRGGRSPFSDPTQHQGILFDGSGTGLLHYVTIRDGDVGVFQRGGGTVSLVDCRVEDNSTGVATGSGASITLRHSRVADNGLGIQVGTGSVVLRRCRIRDNGGPGLSVNGISAGATADVDSCEFRENSSGHLFLDTSSSSVSATVKHTNFVPMIDGTASVKFVSSLCFFFSTDLLGNYWGAGLASGNDVLGVFDARKDCGEGVATWTSSNGDWVQSAYALDLP